MSVYYVDGPGGNGPGGSDGNNGQSVGTAWGTFTFAVNESQLNAGDTLFVRGGTYVEDTIFGSGSVASGTSWSNKVRIANYPGETVWLQPPSGQNFILYLFNGQQYIEFDGINLDGVNIELDLLKIEEGDGYGAHHIRWKNAELKNGGFNFGVGVNLPEFPNSGSIGGNEFINLTIHNFVAGAYPFYLASSNNLIEGCDIYDAGLAGIHAFNGHGVTPTGNICRNNRIHDIIRSDRSSVWGIIDTISGSQYYNNVIYNNSLVGGDAIGIYLYNGSSGAKVWNNTVTGNDAIGIWATSGASNAEIRNNVSWANGDSVSDNYANDSGSTTEDHNLFASDPLFVNPGANDYQLQTGSAAIDGGVDLSVSGGFDYDITGRHRPQGSAWDAGAHEALQGPQGAQPKRVPWPKLKRRFRSHA